MTSEYALERAGRCAGLGIAASATILFWPSAWPAWGAIPFAAGGMLAGILCIIWACRYASADTRPQGGDATEIAAPFTSGAVGEAETPKVSQ